MIPRTAPAWQTINWQKSLADAIRDPVELINRLDLPSQLVPAAINAAQQFPLRVTQSYLSRIRPGDIKDPLLLQVLPLHLEMETQPADFSADPVGDLQAMPIPGLLHKYHGRVLLVTTGACAIHCRYCFRRHYPYSQAQARNSEWQAAIDYIQADASIEEVILSGGDPLSLANDKLARLIHALEAIPHLQRLRIHSRHPVVLPERIDQELLQLLSATRLQCILVIHCNHARELDQHVTHVLQQLANHGCTLLNQSVLLRGINDKPEVLRDLSLTLFNSGVLPYYLHQMDRVDGAAHFAVSRERALVIHQQLRDQLPGYLVPKLVEEIAGQPAKLAL